MSSVGMRWGFFGALAAALAAAVVVVFPAVPVSGAPGTITLADSDDDQLNLMEQQEAQQTAQENQDIARQEQQLVDAQNAFDESMTAGNN